MAQLGQYHEAENSITELRKLDKAVFSTVLESEENNPPIWHREKLWRMICSSIYPFI